jgi:hypothetical protein
MTNSMNNKHSVDLTIEDLHASGKRKSVVAGGGSSSGGG